jgi:murein DD-endopeptidase MepM/ murein hydrolase activator NlpD
VKTECPKGCVEAPKGTPDYCKDTSDYLLPFDCGTTHTCSNGNHTSTHTGKDEYAYDFSMPVGTTLRAMRGGKVLRVRNPSPPGSACYDGGGTSCANFANTIEILHADGSVGLYMHLSKLGVSAGQSVNQGDVIGKSGQSGWVTGPHVHVQVQSNCGIWWCQSVPFKFVEKSPITSGTSCKSENC